MSFPQQDRALFDKITPTCIINQIASRLNVFFISLLPADSTPFGCGCPNYSPSSTSTNRIRTRCRMAPCVTCWPTKWTNLMLFLLRRRRRRVMYSGLQCWTGVAELELEASLMTRTCWTWAKSSCAKRYVNGCKTLDWFISVGWKILGKWENWRLDL